jgi:hypothetical protein
MKAKIVGLMAVGLLAAPAAYSADITYSVDETIGLAGSVVGTVETDGTTGVLAAANLLDWNLVLNIGGSTGSTFTLFGPLSGNNSQVVVGAGGNFTATATDLLFNFSGAADLVDFQNPGVASGMNAWCLDAQVGACSPVTGKAFLPSPGEFVLTSTNTITQGNNVLSGDRVIGTVIGASVPEPATLSLLSLGLAALGFMRRRRAN